MVVRIPKKSRLDWLTESRQAPHVRTAMSALFTALTDVFQNGQGEKLPLEAERAAILSAQAGDEEATISLVYAYAFALRMGVAQYRHAGGAGTAEVDDLRQSALLGLLEAIHAFDPETHHRLAATIGGYIADAIAGSGAAPIALAVPERTLKRFYGILREAEGDVVRGAELAPSHAMTAETFRAVLEAVRNVTSYDAETTHEEDTRGASVTAGTATAVDSIAEVEDAILVANALEAIEGVEEDVVGLRYGFTEYNPLSDAEIGERLELSRQKVQRTAMSALGKMRSRLGVA
jgi:RNA polymerase sigma factor (sigma-70 family)